MTLDELFLAYEAAMERQKRQMEVIGAALGGTPSGSKDGDKKQYKSGKITIPPSRGEKKGHTLFGYKTTKRD